MSDTVSLRAASVGGDRSALPVSGLLALALLGFIAILTETLPAGLLPQIGRSLHVGDALTGQLVTLYALGSVVAAIPGAVLTRRWNRRGVLLMAIGGFLVFNAVTGVSSNYDLTLAARFLAGAAAGITWGLVPVYARQMAPARLQGRAMAFALVGTPLALSLGVPLGTWLGNLVGWRLPFAAMSFIALVLVGWVLASVPDFPAQRLEERRTILEVLRLPGIRPILGVVLAWMLGHNILYTYIAPYLQLIGLQDHVATVLLVFGVGALAGIWATGALIDQSLRRLVLLSLTAFAVMAAALLLGRTIAVIAYPAALIWGLTFGGAATLLQTASADTAGADADLAQSMIVTVWNAAIAGGGIIGGLLLQAFGPASFAPAILLLALAAAAFAQSSRSAGFVPGPRAASRSGTVAGGGDVGMTILGTNEGAERLGDGQPDEWLACARNTAAHAVRAGDFAPTFRLPDVHGGNRALINLIEQGPLVLSFYRGIWCDFCVGALETLGGLDGKIRELGASQVAIGPRPANDAERSKLQAFPMPLLVDRALKVTTAYGLAIALPDHLQEQYARFGCVPGKIADGGEWKIPVPATYVIGRDGRVAMAMIDADYRTRMPSGHLLSALRGLRRGWRLEALTALPSLGPSLGDHHDQAHRQESWPRSSDFHPAEPRPRGRHLG